MTPFDASWDVLVIGTGIGGGTSGRALAEAGRQVLFLEKGRAGYRAEETPLDIGLGDPVARGLRGLWPDPVQARVDGVERSFLAPLGCGVGGSSVFYAATLEAPERHDLDDLPDRPHPTGGWPVGFDAFLPYLDRARALYAIRGEADPLSDVPVPTLVEAGEPSPGDAAIMSALRRNGLHPYRLHAALRHLDGCAECLGRKCPRPCKMDGRSAGVEPALATGNAALVDQCEVLRIVTEGDKVTGVEVRHGGETRTIPAARVILAAGALSSPRLLQASGGLADRSGLVGRNLMFHLNEVFALWPGRAEGFAGPSKSVGFRDHYFAEGQRLGMVQAMGIDVGYGEIVHTLRERLARSPLRSVPALPGLMRVPAAIGAKVLGTAKLFVGLLEDLPYAENRVRDEAGRIAIDYRIAPELLARRKLFRRLIRASFKGTRTAFLSHAPEPNFGHPCGTLRMGQDPATSVVDGWGRAHDVAGLWVADASVFPTSMGVNPSLTIAAHALRVAQAITEEQT